MFYLYIKTHNITGLKYLGYTKKNPYKYRGSGHYWLRHIKKHSYDVNTEILYSTENLEELKHIAIFYSKIYIIVDDKSWANLVEERCQGAGCYGKINGMFGKTHSPKTKKKLSECCAARFKNKTYEELYGPEKAQKLKQIRAERFKLKNNKKENNSRFDHTIYSFFNRTTNDLFIGTRFDFYTKYKLHKGAVSAVINHNKEHKDWFLVSKT